MITGTARQRAAEYLTDVPALTVLPPWPVAMTWPDEAVRKTIENRVWEPSARVDRFLLHAGKRWDSGWGVLFSDRNINWGTAVSSAITAVVDIAHVCSASLNRHSVVCNCGPWARAGQRHWRLCNVIPLPEPVQCNGRQKFWRPERAVVAAVAEQLAEIRFTPKEPTNV